MQDLYRNDDIARALLDDAAERSYVVAKTWSPHRAHRRTTRAKAVELCKLLDDIGVGTYKRAYTKDTDKFPARTTGTMCPAASDALQRVRAWNCRIFASKNQMIIARTGFADREWCATIHAP